MPLLPSESFLPHPTPPTDSCLGLFQEMAWGAEGKRSLQGALRERTLVGWTPALRSHYEQTW